MCLVKMKVEHEDEVSSPPRRIIVHPVSQHGSDRIIVASSRPVSRAHSHRSSRRISIVEPATTTTTTTTGGHAPRPSQYVLSSSPPHATTTITSSSIYGPRASIPRIIHAAPSPPRSPRPSHSPRVSYTSVHSSGGGGHGRTHSRHGSLSGGSPRGSRTRVVSDGDVVYVSAERERAARRLSTGQYLTAAGAAARGRDEVIDSYGYAESPRQNLYLEDGDRGGADVAGLRARSRSITYATTGPRLSRERVLIDQDGRRRESYQIIGGR